ncbi:thiamine pyrophosphate-dependent enzyme [Siccirubricoccus sp. G192]|uniref:thiamine pyrophosphate-dependent enzyme n=1 Tax=Siccirubricoccus sp. G192 TaxID=2849651 RepID=UPI0020C3E86B|nr:thiamine pyrophosphate-dependent enzyme [Siccirubricoccus sp. G192]
MADTIETGETGKLRRRSVVRTLLRDRGGMLVIGGLGAPAWDITAAGDCPENLPLWGGMGGAAMMGLGLALAQPERRVLVITGDGEMLMGVGSLASIAVQRPKNLSIVVLDNEHYGETGMQETHTKHGVDLAGMAKAAGIPDTRLIRAAAEVQALREAIHAGNGPPLRPDQGG